MPIDREKAIARVKARSFSAGDYGPLELAESVHSHLLEAYGYLSLLQSTPGGITPPALVAFVFVDGSIEQISSYIKQISPRSSA